MRDTRLADRRAALHRDWPRGISLVVVVAALAALLAAGAELPRHRGHAAAAGPGTLLPAVSLTTGAATVWNCPGPLPVSGGSTASISVANPSERGAVASVLVAETAVTPGQSKGQQLADRVLTLRIGPGSERSLPISAEPVPAEVPVTTTTRAGKRPGLNHAKPVPPVVDASVSLTASGAGLAVEETVNSPSGILASPCAVGSSAQGFTASGVTSGSSDVHVALFNPSSAPAVVNVSVGTTAGIVQPPTFQGVVVAPKALTVLDLADAVPQRSHVAIAVKAAVGRVAIGSLTSVSARFTTKLLGPAHSYTETGQQLAVGVGRPLSRWLMPVGPLGTNISEAVRIFDPGARPASVTLRTAVEGLHPSTLSITVPAGATVTATAPVVSGKGAPGSSTTTTSTSAPTAAAAKTAREARATGTVSVSSANGVGVVVEHETYRTESRGHLNLQSSSPVAAAATTWLVPGLEQTHLVGGRVTITAASSSAVTVVVEQIFAETATSGAPAPFQLASVQISAGSSIVMSLQSIVSAGSGGATGAHVSVPDLAVEVRATGPVLVTGGLLPTRSGSLSGVEAGVPALQP